MGAPPSVLVSGASIAGPVASTRNARIHPGVKPAYSPARNRHASSTVCTSAKSSESTKLPASSKVSRPTMRRGSECTGTALSAAVKSAAPNFAAHPAHRANAVRRIASPLAASP